MQFDKLKGGSYHRIKCLQVISLGRHGNSRKRSVNSPHICDVCSKQFPHRSKLNIHKQQAHANHGGEQRNDEFLYFDRVVHELLFDVDMDTYVAMDQIMALLYEELQLMKPLSMEAEGAEPHFRVILPDGTTAEETVADFEDAHYELLCSSNNVQNDYVSSAFAKWTECKRKKERFAKVSEQ